MKTRLPPLIHRDQSAVARPLLWVMLLLCLSLRLSYPLQIEFKADEASAIRLALQNISGPPFALKGLRSSTGLYNPPFFIYLLSPAVWVSSDPVFVTYVVIALNLCGLAIFYVLLRRLLPQDTALLVLMLFASSPWAILYARKIWAQDCLFPFVILFYLLILLQLNGYRRHRTWILFALLAAVSQLHMSAWFLPLPLIVWLVLFRIEMRFADILIGLSILLLAYWPYLRFLAGPEPSGLLAATASRSEVWALPTMVAAAMENAGWSFAITGATGFAYVLGESGLRAFTATYPVRWLYPLFAVYYVLAVIGLAWALKTTIAAAGRQRHAIGAGEKLTALLLFVFLGIQISYFLLSVPAHPHYSIVFYPIIAIFTGCWIQTCKDSGHAWLQKAVSTAVVLIIIANLIFSLSFFEFIRKHPEKINGDFGTPYAVARHSMGRGFDE